MTEIDQRIDGWRRDLKAAGISSAEVLAELEGHLRDDIEQRMRSGLQVQQAFELAVRRMGDPSVLVAEFAKVANSTSRARIHAVLLAALAVQLAASAGMFFWLAGISAASGPVSLPRTPEWALPWHAALGAVYVMAIVVTFLALRWRPAAGLRMMRWLNWALLPVLPFGTLLGVYGLWIDRAEVRRRPAAAGVS
jgi:hypothetical protein